MKNPTRRRSAAPLALLLAVATAACAPHRPTVAASPAPVRPVIAVPSHQGNSSDVALVRHGEVVGRITTDWTQTVGGSPVRRKLLTLYREGRPPRTFELPASGTSPARATRPPAILRNASVAVAPAFHVATGGGCGSEFDAMFGAIASYWAADDAMGGCLGGHLGCFGAAMDLVGAWDGLVAAEAGLSWCLMT